MNIRQSKLSKAIAVGGCSLLLALSATAGYKTDRNSHIDFAKVTSVEPIFATVEHQVPREQCWNERVAIPQHYGRHGQQSATPMLFGALVGGALGNELGHHKRNKQVGTVVGALLGGSIAKDIQRKNSHHHPQSVSYRTEQRCETYYETEIEQQIVGYQVDYKYRGRHYQTQTVEDPGDRLQVRVAVTPIE